MEWHAGRCLWFPGTILELGLDSGTSSVFLPLSGTIWAEVLRFCKSLGHHSCPSAASAWLASPAHLSRPSVVGFPPDHMHPSVHVYALSSTNIWAL